MKRWLAQLAPNDRRALLFGAAALAVLVAYLLVWAPLNARLQQLRATVREEQSLAQWMQQAARDVAQLRGAAVGVAPVADEQSLLAVVDQSAKNGNLGTAMKRVEPEGQDSVRVWLEQASFDDLVRWLDALQHQHGVRVANVVIERQDTPGTVNARVALQGGGA